MRLHDLLGAHTGGVGGGHHRPAGGAADRVGPVEDDEARPCLHGGLHGRVHRPDVGVEARTRVLDVEHDGVHAGGPEHRGHLVGAGAVGVVDRDAGARVRVRALRVAGLGGAPKAVLGAEDAPDVDGPGLVHLVDDRPQVGEYAGGVGDDPDLAARERGPAGGSGPVRARGHRAGRVGDVACHRLRGGTGSRRRQRHGSGAERSGGEELAAVEAGHRELSDPWLRSTVATTARWSLARTWVGSSWVCARRTVVLAEAVTKSMRLVGPVAG